jgi:heptosyltransferase-2
MVSFKHIACVHFEIPLGAAVIATATLRSLKEACPGLQVTVIASGHSLNILEASPYVDHILSSPNPIKNPLRSFLYAVTRIWPRRHEFDAIVLDDGNRRSLITVFAILTGIKLRIGYSVRPWLLHLPAHHALVDSNIIRNNHSLDSVVPSGLKISEPTIFFCPNDVEIFQAIFEGVAETRPRVVFATETSAGHPNAWFSDRFVMLGKSLIREHNAFVILVGAAANQPVISSIRDQIGPGSISLAGKTSPRQLAALMAGCDFCVSVDTGAMHVARGVTLPTVILGNAAQPVGLWLPPADLKYIELIRKDHLPCSICWKLKCETRECMDEISVQDVEYAFTRLKKRVPWGPVPRENRLHVFSNRQLKSS